MTAGLDALNMAFAVLGQNADVTDKSRQVLPTARTRAAIDMLSFTTAEKLAADEVNLREVAVDLFNWADGASKVTKVVVREMNALLNTPGKYSHAVELLAFLSAAAPLLEPDRIARLMKAVEDVETSFAPTAYTMQMSRKLRSIFEAYSDERRERLMRSLWVQSHTGRWWDLTAGDDAENHMNPGAEIVELTDEEFLELFKSGKAQYSVESVRRVKELPESDEVRFALEDYKHALMRGHAVDPDIALLSSYVPWLTSLERPESPVVSLLDALLPVVEEDGYVRPEKPREFHQLFPNVQFLDNAARFPQPLNVQMRDGKMFGGCRYELVKTSPALAANRTYMGNCTWTYKGRMEQGTYALFRIHDSEGNIYNASMMVDGNGWRVGEINSRHNRGNVPNDIREAFTKMVAEVGGFEETPEFRARVEAYSDASRAANRKYTFKVM